ncbi:hypothetical protein CDAR_177531 [Caerostris darwini]|uniref:Uncharacterized protein n=1 Tax=Caerostris darwini TaxID=1538125 RepID=A0AAV4P1N2_9ARAC|nr:hypothetical protein CDAR_177531 [Caerostris darwini]
MFSVTVQFKTFLPQNTVRLALPSLSQYGIPRAKSYRPSLPLTLLGTSQKRKKNPNGIISERGKSSITKDAFLITLFGMRNQSGRVVSPLLNNKGKNEQPPSKKWKGVQSGCGCPDDYFRWFHTGSTSLRFSGAETLFEKNAKCKMLFFMKFKKFLPQDTVRLSSSFSFSVWDPLSKIISPIITSHPLSDKPEKKKRKALMESFRSKENHQFSKDAFLITLFGMRNQSDRVVSPLLYNKGKNKAATWVERGAIWMWMSRRLS